jgi:hypothetical protein
MQITQKLRDKKIRYIMYSIAMFVLFLWVDVFRNSIVSGSADVLVLFLVAILGSYITQYPSSSRTRGFLVSLLPLSLTLGTYLTLYHFPNFSLPFKVLGLAAVAVLFYLISLVNNIFLVVEEKQEIIPLYRVAVTWGQIILVVVSITLFAGIYKFSQGFFVQSAFAALLGFVYTWYFLWNLSFDPRLRSLTVVDTLINCLFSAFVIFALASSVSFIPAEPFLRALFSASVLLFNLNYLDGHMKNRINTSLVYSYGAIFVLFLFFILVFGP